VLLIRPIQSLVVRHAEWQRLGLVTMGFTIALVIASGDRPLFPAQTIFSALRENFPQNEFISEECGRYVDGGYRNSQARRDYLLTALPASEKTVGYFPYKFDVDEPGLWLPFGRRSVVCILPEDSPAYLRAQGIKYLVTYGKALPEEHLSTWLKEYNATVVGQFTFQTPGLKNPNKDLYLIRLN